MKFLGIDTSGARLSLVAVNGETVIKSQGDVCAQTHSVRLMDEIGRVLALAHMSAGECDFFAVVVGPGSFTGIRIGIATVKGLCFALEKPALAVTSLDAIAYAETGVKRLALVDALHGNFYACAYNENGGADTAPAFLNADEVNALIEKGYAPATGLTAEGLYHAIIAKKEKLISAGELTALYLRKSSAEENK